MKLTGLQIFKYLPGGRKEPEANCKKCGFPTCMAFSMKLAKGEATIDKCAYVSDELRILFEEASRVQQQEITFGPIKRQVKVGNETVMFRHDKKFVNPTCLSIRLNSSDADFTSKLEKITGYSIERVGEDLTLDAVALFDSDESFEQKAKQIAGSGFPLILVSSNFDNLVSALNSVKETRPLVYFENSDTDKQVELQQKFDVPVVITGSNIEELVNNSFAALEKKTQNIVLNLNRLEPENMLQDLTYIRRAAIEDKFKPLGFPVISFQKDIGGFDSNPVNQGIIGSVLLCKYSNIVVLDDFNEAIIYAFLTLRQNIFTDPEKPLQIEPRVYPIGEVDESSPVIVTTNFALTYFTVAGEIESSNISSYLVVTPSDGMSVLTAWSADKFNGEIIAKTIKEYNLANLVKHRKLIIPGYVAGLKEEIEEEIPEWEVIPGANEAVDIVEFLKEYRHKHMNIKA